MPGRTATPEAPRTGRLRWSTVAKRAIVVVLGGIAIYLVFPSITEVVGAGPRLSTLDPLWFIAAVGAELVHFGCTFALQRLAQRTREWFPVVTSQLAGNAVTNILPAGAAAGAALQYRMLARAGMDPSAAVGGLTATSLLGVGGLLALPLFALPVIAAGAPVNSGLVHTAVIGVVGFVLFVGFGTVVMATDRPLVIFGEAVQRVRNRILHRRPPLTGFDDRLVAERNVIRSVLGEKWHQAVLLSAGRLGFGYLCLLFALRATGSYPRPSLVLLAFALAGAIALVPITPGGLGIVEAGMSGLLILAGVGPGDAFLATLTYRLASYWLPLVAGPISYYLFRRRYGAPDPSVPPS